MLLHRLLLLIVVTCGGMIAADHSASGTEDRAYTVSVLTRIAEPVLIAGSKGELTATLKKEGGKLYSATAPLECIGRVLAGIAPWLELGPDDSDEGKIRAKLLALAIATVQHGCDPNSPDRVDFIHKSRQPIVDAAYLAQAMLRARTQLWNKLSPTDQANLIAGLISTRINQPWNNNWLLFAGLIEATLWELTGTCEMKPIDTAVESFEKWYLGDGTYGDGPSYHWDYYNSFVIHPMYLAILEICAKHHHAHGNLLAKAQSRAERYAQVQERLISPEGTFPVIGRSSTYRFAAFQHLADTALRHRLPASLKLGATRTALTTIILNAAIAALRLPSQSRSM